VILPEPVRIFVLVLAASASPPAALAYDEAAPVIQDDRESPKVWHLDPFGGYSALYLALGEQNEMGETVKSRFSGWGAGATIRFPDLAWFGVTGSYGQNAQDGVRLRHFRAGITLTTTYVGDYASRGFVHALVGSSALSSGDDPSQSGLEFNAGGGIDMFGVVRLRFDWVRLNLPGYPSDNFELFLGGVLPLCFGGAAEDCIEVK
jgi:hypothetical protein